MQLKFLRSIMNFIRFEHTLFALPFAAIGAILGCHGLPSIHAITWIFICMVTARSAAMAYNRIVDRDIDAQNPRTSSREIPAGVIGVPFAVGFTVVMSIGFILASSQLNQLALFLSPVALLIAFGYSHAKRFTAFSHAWLGLALSIAPVGAWIAVTGSLTLAPCVIGASVVCWLIGFDTLYALQDMEFDKKTRLHSIPSRFGLQGSLKIARISHAVMILFLGFLPFIYPLGWPYAISVGAVASVLCYEHYVMNPTDMKKVNIAFFKCNIAISLILMTGVLVNLYV